MSNTRYELRYYPALPLEGLVSTLADRLPDIPPHNRELVDGLKESIDRDGLRNPLTVEWFDPYDDRNNPNPYWSPRIGNNRLVALLELDEVEAPCLVIVPEGVTGPAGTYETLSVDAALALFDATHPWWHSYILRRLKPQLVPRCA